MVSSMNQAEALLLTTLVKFMLSTVLSYPCRSADILMPQFMPLLNEASRFSNKCINAEHLTWDIVLLLY